MSVQSTFVIVCATSRASFICIKPLRVLVDNGIGDVIDVIIQLNTKNNKNCG